MVSRQNSWFVVFRGFSYKRIEMGGFHQVLLRESKKRRDCTRFFECSPLLALTLFGQTQESFN